MQDELLRPNRFIQLYPNITTASSLHWQLVNSARNGLDQSGAVIRKYMRPEAKRAVIYIDVPRYFAWLRGDSKAAAA